MLSLLFASRDFAHIAHLNTDNDAAHRALGAFYDGIIEQADSLAEMWMGKNLERVGVVEATVPRLGEDPVEGMQWFLDEVAALRDDVAEDDTTLQNQMDSIVGLFYTTIFKLQFLK